MRDCGDITKCKPNLLTPEQIMAVFQPEMDFTGPALRDAGIARVLLNNRDYKAEFHSTALHFLDKHGSVTSEDVVEEIGMPVGHPSAVGAAMRSFAVSEGLRISHYRKSVRPSCHSAVIAVWTR